MVVVAAVGLALGSDIYLSVPPLSENLLPLIFHGSLSEVVIGPLAMFAAGAIVRVVALTRGRRAERIVQLEHVGHD